MGRFRAVLLSVLKRCFGAEQALAIWVWCHRWFGLLVGFGGVAALGVGFVLIYAPARHVAGGYETAQVLSIFPLPSTYGRQSAVLVAKPQSGEQIRLRVLEHSLTGAVDDVCLEKRGDLAQDGSFLRFHHAGACHS